MLSSGFGYYVGGVINEHEVPLLEGADSGIGLMEERYAFIQPRVTVRWPFLKSVLLMS